MIGFWTWMRCFFFAVCMLTSACVFIMYVETIILENMGMRD
jgi:hypothetical protein